MEQSTQITVPALVIGGGPAGLMAAEMLARAGHGVLLAEKMPTLGRKFLMAGRSGLNLTKNEDHEKLRGAYGAAIDWLEPALAEFGAAEVQDWARGLGQKLFTGSTGRVFPAAMKASPLLRAWIARLEAGGVTTRTRWRWTGWDRDIAVFETPEGPVRVGASATVLALGGASWARLGSDGAWSEQLAALGVELAPFAPTNAGVSINWTDRMVAHFGTPLKGIALRAAEHVSRGEIVLSARGIEGGGIYPLSPALREGAGLRDRSCAGPQPEGGDSQTVSAERKGQRRQPFAATPWARRGGAGAADRVCAPAPGAPRDLGCAG